MDGSVFYWLYVLSVWIWLNMCNVKRKALRLKQQVKEQDVEKQKGQKFDWQAGLTLRGKHISSELQRLESRTETEVICLCNIKRARVSVRGKKGCRKAGDQREQFGCIQGDGRRGCGCSVGGLGFEWQLETILRWTQHFLLLDLD